MNTLFISNSRKHRDLTERLAAYLRDHELNVWWDEALEARGDFDDQLKVQLTNAKAVVIIWTPEATVSKWVRRDTPRI